MPIDLAILIPTLVERAPLCNRVVHALRKQISEAGEEERVYIMFNIDQGESKTGKKRNELIQDALFIGAKYISFFDDDDYPGPTYIKNYLACIEGGFDCSELWGQIYWSGNKGMPFHHSIVYSEWWQDKRAYYRTINHLNCTKLEIAKQFPFPEISFGEDGQQSIAMNKSGLLKTMYPCKDIIYHYFCGAKQSAGELEAIKQLQ